MMQTRACVTVQPSPYCSVSCRFQEIGSIQASFFLRAHLAYLSLFILSNGLPNLHPESKPCSSSSQLTHATTQWTTLLEEQPGGTFQPWQPVPHWHPSFVLPIPGRHQSHVAHVWAHFRPSMPSPAPTSFTLHIPFLTPLDPHSPDSDLLDPSGFQPWPSNPAP